MINKRRKTYIILIKLAILIASCSFIWYELNRQQSKIDTLVFWDKVSAKEHGLSLLVVGVLMIVNLSIEAVKWKRLIGKIETLSFGKAFQAIFSGLSVGIFTPNRIGEFGGRILFLEESHRIRGALITFIGSVPQMLVTIIAGGIAFIFYFDRYISEQALPHFLVFYITLILIILLVYCYFNINLLSEYFSHLKIFKRISKYTEVFSYYHVRELLPVFSLSVLRYIVFSLQYYLLLRLFIGQIDFLPALMMISLVFFVQSILPSFALTEIGVRGAVATYFIGLLTPHTSGILAAAFGLWLVNIILPAVLGLVFILNLNFFGTHSSSS